MDMNKKIENNDFDKVLQTIGIWIAYVALGLALASDSVNAFTSETFALYLNGAYVVTVITLFKIFLIFSRSASGLAEEITKFSIDPS